MKRGQTIAAEREYVESESERLQARKKIKRNRTTSVLLVLLLLVIFAFGAYTWMKNIAKEVVRPAENLVEEFPVTAEIVDESGQMQVSMRTREYIGQLEADLGELGYKVMRVTLPGGMTRELYIDIEGLPYYFKVNMERGTGVSAEDISRMIRFLEGKEGVSYVDVRIEGKAYYK